MKALLNKLPLLALAAILFGPVNSCKLFKHSVKVDNASHKIQFQYIPLILQATYLGMPYADYQKARLVMPQQTSNIMDFRIEYTETFEDNDIREVTYYFDKDNKQPLYEYIIVYKDITKLHEVVQKLGHPNDGSEWIFDSGEGFMIKIWTFENKLVIAGVIKGTEWDN